MRVLHAITQQTSAQHHVDQRRDPASLEVPVRHRGHQGNSAQAHMQIHKGAEQDSVVGMGRGEGSGGWRPGGLDSGGGGRTARPGTARCRVDAAVRGAGTGGKGALVITQES